MITSKTKAKAGDMQDRLSNLPDAILTHILSFLKTKDAVRTSILSTRWKSVWASVPTLKLNKLDFRSKGNRHWVNDDKEINARLSAFLDRVLMDCKEPSFEKIAICGQNLDPYHVKSWIGGAIKRNVCELVVMTKKCFVNPPCKLTQSLFSCNKLVVLKLGLDMVLYFPMTCPCFPNLKVLELYSLFFKNDNSTQNLVSCCPVLKDLVIVRENWDDLGTLNVNSGSLKKLSLRVNMGRQRFIRRLAVDAPGLESIVIEDMVTQEFVMKDLSSLIKAKLNLSNCRSSFQTYGKYGMCLFELLRRISNVKCLTLSSSTMKSLSKTDSYNLPTFRKLTSLEIIDVNSGKDNWRWKLLIEILKSSPVLEILIFQGLPTLDYECGTSSSQWEVPTCLIKHLETLKFIYDDDDDDFEKVRYFPENPKARENMSITSATEMKSWRFLKCFKK